ncbi:putative Zn finger in ubiquitin hydrolase [Trypanosoma vivax]|nr:hypothetical protein TRVL_00181 [Trypanosoma vivax]KAH8613873.1 putative Zn finger in ubiquitin hydrolase [Trypanosoma vivax]
MIRYRVTNILADAQECEVMSGHLAKAKVGHVQLLRHLSFKRKFFVPFIPTKHIALLFQTRNAPEQPLVSDETVAYVSRYLNWLQIKARHPLKVHELLVCSVSGCTVVVIECPDMMSALAMHSLAQDAGAPTVGSRYVLAFQCENSELVSEELDKSYYTIPTCTFCADRLEPTLTGYHSPTCRCEDDRKCSCQLEHSSCIICKTLFMMQCGDPAIRCAECDLSGDPWICLVCGFAGCSRYQARHAEGHYRQCRHFFSMSLLTQQIWDYDSDAFVHRVVLLHDNATGAVHRVKYPDRDTLDAALGDVMVDSFPEKSIKQYINAKFDSKVEMSNERLACAIRDELSTRRAEYERAAKRDSGRGMCVASSTQQDYESTPLLYNMMELNFGCGAQRERWHALCSTNRNLEENIQKQKKEERALQGTVARLQSKLRDVTMKFAEEHVELCKQVTEVQETIKDIETNIRMSKKVAAALEDNECQRFCVVDRTDQTDRTNNNSRKERNRKR